MTANRASCALSLRPCQPRNRRERLHCLIHHSTSDAQQLADLIGCRYDRLLAYANVNGSDELPLRHLVALTRVTGRTFALAAEAAECGYLLIKEPHALTASDPMSELADVFVSTGTLAERHKAHVLARAPETLDDVIAAARKLQADIAEFVQAAESFCKPEPLRVLR